MLRVCICSAVPVPARQRMLRVYRRGAVPGGDATPGSAIHLKKGPASATLETTVPSGDANESVTLLAMAPDESGF